MRKILLSCVFLILICTVDFASTQVNNSACGVTKDNIQLKSHFTPMGDYLDVLPTGKEVCFVGIADGIPVGTWLLVQDTPNQLGGWLLYENNVEIAQDSFDWLKRYKDPDKVIQLIPGGTCFEEKINLYHNAQSPNVWIVSPEKSFIPPNRIEALDVFISKVMKQKQSPVFYWFTEGSALDIDRYLPRVEQYAGQAILKEYGWRWDGCTINKSQGILVTIAAVMVDQGPSWSTSTLLHERAHTFGAIHGAMGLAFGHPVDNANVIGPRDAHWWSLIGDYAFNSVCSIYPSHF